MDTENMCKKCLGTTVIRRGEMYADCDHCKGTGLEPPPRETDLEAAGQATFFPPAA